MSQSEKVQSFREQMAGSMAELRSIMEKGQSPTADQRLTVRTVEIADPGEYTAGSVRALRRRLGLSQATFAQVMGVSHVLVRCWERGTRTPSATARRLFDQLGAEPNQLARLVRRSRRPVAGASR